MVFSTPLVLFPCDYTALLIVVCGFLCIHLVVLFFLEISLEYGQLAENLLGDHCCGRSYCFVCDCCVHYLVVGLSAGGLI